MVPLAGPDAVTPTSTTPEVVVAGESTVTCVSETTTMLVPASAPNVTPVTYVRFVPFSVTRTPPLALPLVGPIDEMVGALYVTAAERLATPPAVVTETATLPAPEGAVAVILVAVFVTMVPASDPNFTELALVRLVPSIVTLKPPITGPLVGETDVMEGADASLIVRLKSIDDRAIVPETRNIVS